MIKFFRNISIGIRNIRIFWKAVWNFRPWSFASQIELERLSMLESWTYYMDRPDICDCKDARIAKICTKLLGFVESAEDIWWAEKEYSAENDCDVKFVNINIKNHPKYKELGESTRKSRFFAYGWMAQKAWRLYNSIRKEQI